MDPSEITARAATRGIILATILTLILVACGTAAPSTPPVGSVLPGGSAPPASNGTAPAPVTIDDLVSRLTDLDGSEVLVTGHLLISDGEAQLCGALLESYPPQCGGPMLRVLGEVPQAVLDGLDTTGVDDPRKVWWGSVQIDGVVDAGGGSPTITIDSIRVFELS